MARKSILPKTWSDRFAFTFTVVGVIAVVLVELFLIIPRVYDVSNRYFVVAFHSTCGMFLAINVLGNLYKTISTDTSSGSKVMPSVLKKGWRYCYVCEANAPPRSHHCGICKACVLRRDHHCTFTGCCIGFHNYRYYYMFLFHISIGALYVSVFNFNVVTEAIGGFSFGNIIMHVFPIGGWILGVINIYQLAWISFSALCTYSFIFCLALMLYQASLFLYGQTAFEKRKKVDLYHYGGWKEHLIDFFGTHWFLVWIFPTIESPLLTDGTEFFTKETYTVEFEKHR